MTFQFYFCYHPELVKYILMLIIFRRWFLNLLIHIKIKLKCDNFLWTQRENNIDHIQWFYFDSLSFKFWVIKVLKNRGIVEAQKIEAFESSSSYINLSIFIKKLRSDGLISIVNAKKKCLLIFLFINLISSFLFELLINFYFKMK